MGYRVIVSSYSETFRLNFKSGRQTVLDSKRSLVSLLAALEPTPLATSLSRQLDSSFNTLVPHVASPLRRPVRARALPLGQRTGIRTALLTSQLPSRPTEVRPRQPCRCIRPIREPHLYRILLLKLETPTRGLPSHAATARRPQTRARSGSRRRRTD